jgi:hypothetical protein
VFLLAGSWFLTHRQMGEKSAEVSVLKKNLGEFSDVLVDDIDAKSSKAKKFLAQVKNIPLKSSYTPVMLRLIKLMPKGMWLESFSMNEKDARDSSKGTTKTGSSAEAGTFRLVLQFSGFLFLNDTNLEFSETDHFVTSLRADPVFSANFKDIKLSGLKAQDVEGRSVTAFSVICQ